MEAHKPRVAEPEFGSPGFTTSQQAFCAQGERTQSEAKVLVPTKDPGWVLDCHSATWVAETQQGGTPTVGGGQWVGNEILARWVSVVQRLHAQEA